LGLKVNITMASSVVCPANYFLAQRQ